MKKIIIISVLGLMVGSCAPAVTIHHSAGVNELVWNKRNHTWYVLDSVMHMKKHPDQVFYAAHELNGKPVTWLPAKSLKQYGY